MTNTTQEKKSEAPPLPYSLADLQIDANRRLGLSAQQVLDACQRLYETHRLTTYPRSDCSYLPEGHLAQARDVLAAIRKHSPALQGATENANLSLRFKAWNNKKVTAHHAIIPTPNESASPNLSEFERGVFELICRRYLVQFYPAFEYLQTKVELTVAGETFRVNGRRVGVQGWKTIAVNATIEDSESGGEAALPELRNGDVVATGDVAIAEKKTQAPKPFNDASLIEAMCNVAKFVTNANVKKMLSEVDGIGTPATRAAIIETLFERGYVTRVKKNIVSAATGRALIAALPEVATTPDLTALWEAAMRAINEGTQTLEALLDRVTRQLQQLVEQGRALGTIAVPRSAAPAKSNFSPRSLKRGHAAM